MIITFYKRQFDEMVIEIVAEEFTSSVTSENFQDYYGNPGTLTLRSVADNSTISVGLYAIGTSTFEGVVPLADLPVGLYSLEGRVEDILGNAAIISNYHDPQDLPVQPVELYLEVGYNLVPIYSFSGSYNREVEVEGEYNPDVILVGTYVIDLEVQGKFEQEISLPCQ